MKRIRSLLAISATSTILVMMSAAAGPDTPVNADKDATSQPAAATATKPAGRIVNMNGLELNLDARRITFQARVCLTKGPLEFLLCKAGTKDYESLMSTKIKPSDLHVCLLLLGLTPGMPARYYPAEGDWPGHEIPPRGPELAITLKWKDKNGKEHQAPTGSWIINSWQKKYNEESPALKFITWLKAAFAGEKLPFQKPPDKWIFIGSNILPGGGYLADESGEIISVSNFASAVIDVPFESSDKNALRLFEANTDAMPESGTDVTITISPLPGAEKSDYARAMLEIDRNGRMLMEGKPIMLADLPAWGGKFIEKHDKGQVLIRVDSRAPCRFITLAEDNLRFGGVRDFHVDYLSPDLEILPQTAGQLKQAMDEWKDKFANPRDYLREPSLDTQFVMEQIKSEIAELDRLKSLWLEYRDQLQKGLDQYRPTTQPGGANYRPPSE